MREKVLSMLTPLLLAATVAGQAPPAAAAEEEAPPAADLLIILDASGSMWGQVEGENKIVIARRVLKELLATVPDDAEIGLVAYGHRREGDCSDIETVVPMGPADKEELAATVDSLNPKGKTPITAAAQKAFEALAGRDEPTNVILLSDGLETCGGDPCEAVRLAKEAGQPFVFNVIGFDVAGEDVSSLECAAQAGEGVYLAAQNAEELAAALEQTAHTPPEIPPGRISVKAVADGELADASVNVTEAESGAETAGGRTYTREETNPRVLPVPWGVYRVTAKAVGLKGDVERVWEEVEVVEGGEPVELVADFSRGELSVRVHRNGQPSDATVRVVVAGTSQEVAAGRTYTRDEPRVFQLTPGDYDVNISSVEISGKPTHTIAGVTVEAQARAEREHEFSSGTLRLGAKRGGELADATVHVYRADDGAAVGQARTYTSETSNPKTFELEPGSYRVRAKEVRGEASEEAVVEVVRGEVVEQMFDFGG